MVKKAQKKSVISSALITVFIVIMLIISGPAQAVSVIISGLGGTYTKGNSINFTVSVNITDPDKYVPVANISLDVTGKKEFNRTFALDGTPMPSGDPAITITPVSIPQSDQFGYGYGYGVDSESGTGSSFGYGYGYGYGYGAGGGTVTYTYNVTIDTASLPTGSYSAVANLNTGKAAKPAFTSAPATFTISEATIQVTIDIQEIINPNSKGEITVSVLNNTPAGFDVADINVSTVRFGPGNAPVINSNIAANKLILKFDTAATKIQCTDTQATLTGKTYSGQDIIGSDSFKTAGCEGGGGPGGGGSSGGGGVISSEPYENVAKAETVERDLRADKAVKYTYTTLGLYEIDVTGSENEDDVSMRVEELKGTSKLVKESAPGNVYKNFNIWSGTKKIKDARLRYKIENAWLESNGLASSDMKILRWSENKWQLLDTAEIKNDGTYTSVEADTPGFSSFVLTGLKGGVLPTATSTVTQQPEETSTGTGTATITQTPTSEAPPVKLSTIMLVIVLIAIVVVVYFKRKEIFKK